MKKSRIEARNLIRNDGSRETSVVDGGEVVALVDRPAMTVNDIGKGTSPGVDDSEQPQRGRQNRRPDLQASNLLDGDLYRV